ncbi:MAG: HIG1 domain-containing protein [Sphingomonadales bacterium]|nr:HIG1 domain-containing protein [Sphingomonadales bacterium]MBD3773745.1 HIG1 domain-containing protein [Paracoccaceae bacterium]
MKIFLSIVLVGIMAMVVYSLVRGIVAFLHSTKVDLEREDNGQATEMQLLQNKMMFARIKWQALAIVVVAVILAVSGSA